MTIISKRIKELNPSLTLSISDTARKMKAEGKDVISLSAGEPDFDTPQHIKDAAIKAINEGQTKYTAVGGTLELKQAISEKFLRDNSFNYSPSEIIVGSGAKHVLFNLFMTTLQENNEVIIPSPYWVSYPEMIKLTGAKPVIVPCSIEKNYLLTEQQLRKAINNKTRMLILNSPSNPTGSIYTREHYQGFAKILAKYPNVLIISDDIYEHITYRSEPFINFLSVAPEFRDRFFIINGVSKAYSMTGWRIGIGAGDEKCIQAMQKLQGQTTSNACSIAQAAAIAAFSDDLSSTQEMCAVFSLRRDLSCEKLATMPGVKFVVPQGAFYVFPDVSACYESKTFQLFLKKQTNPYSSIAFCKYLLEKYMVAAVPGIAFGDDNAIRISYALDDQSLANALDRIGNCVQDLMQGV